MIHDLRQTLEVKENDFVITPNGGYIFKKTSLGYLDLTSNIEWHCDYKESLGIDKAIQYSRNVSIYHNKNCFIPTKEEFEEAENHGIRSLPSMIWSPFYFWSSTPFVLGKSGMAFPDKNIMENYIYDGAHGNCNYTKSIHDIDNIEHCYNLAVRLITKT